MIVTTTESVPGKTVSEILGVAFGSCVKTKHLGKDIRAGLRTMIGGEVKWYTMMMDEAKKTATERMIKQAKSLGADAIVSCRYTTAMTMKRAAEILAYGTAVKLK